MSLGSVTQHRIAGPGSGLAGEGRHRALEADEVRRVDDGQEVLLDPTQVGLRGRPEPFETALRQDGLRAARVGQAGAPLDEPVADEPVDQARHAALAEEDLFGQLAHPDPSFRRVRDREQGVVFGERDVVLGAQLLIETA